MLLIILKVNLIFILNIKPIFFYSSNDYKINYTYLYIYIYIKVYTFIK